MSSASRRDSRQVTILLHSEKGGEEFLPTCVHCHVARSRQALFNQLHGFPDQPILEDVAFGEKLLPITRPVLLDDYVITDSRKFEKIGI
ncbi:MAG: hypothetical protein ACE1Z4_03500, partial [Gammaproteobacteria bacterium]